MTTLEDIEKAVTELPTDQFAKFRAWFEAFEGARFDQRIERDAPAGRLDRLAEQPGVRANCETFRKPFVLGSV